VILCLSQEDEAPANPVWVTNPRTKARSMVVTVGRKGKHVGVVGVYKTGNPKAPYSFRYQLVEMSEDFLTPAREEKGHPIVALMERYTKELKGENDYLGRYGQMKHLLQAMPPVKGVAGSPTYVGSQRCQKCHRKEYKIWEKSHHSHAYDTLVKARRPGNRQYDPECIVCHTVGFGYQGGFVRADPRVPNDKTATPHLKDVGCESCHGPASLHVANPHNVDWQQRLNPWRQMPKARRLDAVDQLCQKCHDIDNDVTYAHGGFQKKLKEIKHWDD
jgi:hypothetical protein